MTHTKGEWSVWTTMDNTLAIHAMQVPGQPVIAWIEPIGKRKRVPHPGVSEHDAPGDTPSDEEIANANLIAAAPDLYMAVKKYLDWGSITRSDRAFHKAAFSAAIAKAEGKEVSS